VLGPRLQRLQVRSVSDDRDPGVGVASENLGQGGDQRLEPLARAQESERADQRSRMRQLGDARVGIPVGGRGDPVVDHPHTTARADRAGQARLGLADTDHTARERGQKTLDDAIGQALGRAIEVAGERVPVWGVENGQAWKEWPGQPRDRAGLGAVGVDEIGLHVSNDSDEPRERREVSGRRDRAAQIEVHVRHRLPQARRDRR
jgi:hypothetical protein